MAAAKALKFALDIGISKAIVEGDSEVIIFTLGFINVHCSSNSPKVAINNN